MHLLFRLAQAKEGEASYPNYPIPSLVSSDLLGLDQTLPLK